MGKMMPVSEKRRKMGEEERNLYLKERLLQRMEHYRDVSDEEILTLIDDVLTENSRNHYMRLPERTALRQELFNSVRRLDILQELIDDNSVTEIMVNGTDGIYVEQSGAIRRWKKRFTDPEKVKDIVQQIAAGCNRVANEAAAIVDARLPGGERVNAVMPPIALNGPIITIRRFPDQPISMEQLIMWGSISREAAGMLQKCVRAGYNIFISGGTGSRKTTFLNALSDSIPKDERIVTIEDNAELQIQGAQNLVRLEARRANEEGEGEITIRDLIRTSLRMRPDRIIVGEVRGGETLDMLQSLNTGHDGSLSTGHGNSPRDMLSRLEVMTLMAMDLPISAVRRQIASGIDLMVHLGRLRDRTRKVLEILEIDGYDVQTGEIRTHTIYEYQGLGEEKDGKLTGSLKKTGELRHTQKLERAGISLNQ